MIQSIRGMRDVLPEEGRRWRRIEDRIREAIDRAMEDDRRVREGESQQYDPVTGIYYDLLMLGKLSIGMKINV